MGSNNYKKTKKVPYSILISPLGILLYMLYTQITSGSATNIFSQQANYGRYLGILSPVMIVIDSMSKAVTPFRHSENMFLYFIELTELASIIFIIAILITSYKKMKRHYWIYIFSTFILIMFSGGSSSIQRYLLVLFPIYPFLAKYLSKKQFAVTLIIFIALLAVFSAHFLRGYWIA